MVCGIATSLALFAMTFSVILNAVKNLIFNA